VEAAAVRGIQERQALAHRVKDLQEVLVLPQMHSRTVVAVVLEP
jgi:hypothetical protein